MRAPAIDPWITACIRRCQLIGDRASDADARVLVSEIRRLFRDVPEDVRVVDQCLLRTFFGQALSRVARVHHVDENPKTAKALFAFTSSSVTPGTWQRYFRHLLACCARALAGSAHAETSRRAGHLQVDRALHLIDARFNDPDLNLNVVAGDVGLSPFHLSRLLKTHTGQGFVLHLHQRRASAARRLLKSSPMSIKEIGATVGYRSVTQFGRQFKRVYGVSLVSIRSHRAHTRAQAG